MSAAIENAFEVFGLDLCGLMCDNILAYLPCAYSIFTTLDFSPDPTYDPDANKSGWELFWQGVGEWFNGVTKWFDEIDIGIKIGVGLLLFAAACALVIISAPTGAAGLTGAIAAYTGTSSTIAAATVTSMAIAFAVGIASATAMSAAGALLSGGDVVEAMTNAAADAVFWGGVFEFVSAGISAVKIAVRSVRTTKPQPVIQDGVEIRKAQRSDFTGEAWAEIQSLPHNANGETISNAVSGRKIHRGFRTDLIGKGKERSIVGVGRADAIEKNIIYELKPNNARSIEKGIKQLHKYNNALGGKFEMVLIVY